MQSFNSSAARRRLLTGISLGALTATGCFVSTVAMAQEAVPETVVVTGSRINRTGFQTPTPETTISQVELQQKAITSVVSLVIDIPQLQPNFGSGGGITNTGYNTFNLRGLGGSRTLVLVDGRRVADTSPLGGFDINVLPAALIKTVEVVTGGASAAYGSDAVSGVVNIALDNNFEGFKGRAQGGITQYGDSQEWSVSATAGTSFAGGRGHFVISGDTLANYGATSQAKRPWGDDGWAILANPLCGTTCPAGQVKNIIAPNTRLSKMTNGGVIVAGPLKNIMFGDGGVLETFHPGTSVGGTFMTGGDGASFAPYANLSSAVRRYSAYSHVSYDVTDDMNVYADMLYTRNRTTYDVIPNYNNGDITITRQNAYLPAAAAALMDANKITSFLMGRTNIDLTDYDDDLNLANGLNEVARYSVGAKGKLGASWTWDAVVQYTGNHYFDPTGQNRNNVKWALAIDSIANPATGGVAGVPAGQAICRSTLAAPTNGCIPVNLFGPNSIQRSVSEYVIGTSFENAHSYQQYAGFNLQGEPIEDWAGPISFATGFEYRHEGVRGFDDPTSAAAQWRQGNPQPVAGSFNVIEGYGEVVVPLLKDAPLAKNLEFNGAMRETSYSTSGAVTTWKAGLNWTPTDEFRVRATISRDIRAPNLNELFATRNQQITQVTDFLTNVTSNAQILTGGNSNLKPEIGKTMTGGLVYTPGWLSGFTASVDYYTISIAGAISTLSAANVIRNCETGQTSFCSSITRDPSTGLINSVFSTAFNAQTVRTKGVDVEAAYGLPVDDIIGGWGGDLSFRYLGNYLDSFVTVTQGVAANTAGQITGAGPHWRMNLTGTYSNGPWNVTLLERWVAGGNFNNTYVVGLDIADNHVPGRFYTNMTVQYKLNDGLAIYAKVNNLADASPPIVPNSLTEPYTSSQGYFDLLGRTFAVGVRFDD